MNFQSPPRALAWWSIARVRCSHSHCSLVYVQDATPMRWTASCPGALCPQPGQTLRAVTRRAYYWNVVAIPNSLWGCPWPISLTAKSLSKSRCSTARTIWGKTNQPRQGDCAAHRQPLDANRAHVFLCIDYGQLYWPPGCCNWPATAFGHTHHISCTWCNACLA